MPIVNTTGIFSRYSITIKKLKNGGSNTMKKRILTLAMAPTQAHFHVRKWFAYILAFVMARGNTLATHSMN